MVKLVSTQTTSPSPRITRYSRRRPPPVRARLAVFCTSAVAVVRVDVGVHRHLVEIVDRVAERRLDRRRHVEPLAEHVVQRDHVGDVVGQHAVERLAAAHARPGCAPAPAAPAASARRPGRRRPAPAPAASTNGASRRPGACGANSDDGHHRHGGDHAADHEADRRLVGVGLREEDHRQPQHGGAERAFDGRRTPSRARPASPRPGDETARPATCHSRRASRPARRGTAGASRTRPALPAPASRATQTAHTRHGMIIENTQAVATLTAMRGRKPACDATASSSSPSSRMLATPIRPCAQAALAEGV